LLGCGLRLFLPLKTGGVQHLTIPFHSPAIAWFLPLFTRLRLLMAGPVQQGTLDKKQRSIRPEAGRNNG
ncbi:MAG: hypothetical protein IMW89_16125, partial [Ktedonobacteraceae bacterium]|nr:hypothetical protein [Ktedonobacteraceae bacterium]